MIKIFKNYKRAFIPFLHHPILCFGSKQYYQFLNILPEVFYVYVNKYMCRYSPPLIYMVVYTSHNFAPCVVFLDSTFESIPYCYSKRIVINFYSCSIFHWMDIPQFI